MRQMMLWWVIAGVAAGCGNEQQATVPGDFVWLKNLGGTDAAAESAIAAAVNELNQANLNSEVIHTVNLVHTTHIDYKESGNVGTDLGRSSDEPCHLACEILTVVVVGG